jgi:hypothetical protein
MLPDPSTQTLTLEHEDPRAVAPQAVCHADVENQAPADVGTVGPPPQVVGAEVDKHNKRLQQQSWRVRIELSTS